MRLLQSGIGPARLKLWLVALACSVLAPFAQASAAVVTAVDLGERFIALRFDGPVDGASSFVLDGSDRLVVDVAGATPGSAAPTGGMVTRTRQGQYDLNTARIVFELARPAVIYGGAVSNDGRSLLLSLQPVDRATYARAVHAARRSYAAPRTTNSGLEAVVYRPASSSSPLQRAAPPANAGNGGTALALNDPLRRPGRVGLPRVTGSIRGKRPLVVIDAGHGGHDTGALATAYGNRPEKEATLAIAKAIRDALVASGRVRVALTRSDDRFLVLGDRVEIARRLKADLFISVHCDSSPTGASAHGATVYTLSEVASDKVAARIAAQENKSDVINGVDLGAENSDVSSILVDLTQRETMNVSSSFAALLQREMSTAIPFTSNFHRFAGFRVLKAPDTPSVLLETGYVTNPSDARFLFSREGQRKIADGVRRAVEAHFARRLARLEGKIPS
jgi:N-acetylmuramoyl-L-alanine amidase